MRISAYSRPVCREKDVDEVLQISQVFTNVSKGQAAPTADLQKAFNTTDTTEIVKQILTKGELQVGEKEREAKLGNLWKEVAGMVAERVVDPSTKRPYSVSLIEKAMSDIHFNVKADKPAKIQVGSIPLAIPFNKLTLENQQHKGFGVYQGPDAVFATADTEGRDEDPNYYATKRQQTSGRTSPRVEQSRRNRRGRNERRGMGSRKSAIF